jgi:hypothetical protein
MEHHWSEDDDTWFEGIVAADGDLSQWEYLTRTFDNPLFLPEQPLPDEMAMDLEPTQWRENALSEYNPAPYRRHSAGHGVSDPMDRDNGLRRTWPGTIPDTNYAQRMTRNEQSLERIDTSPISFDRQLNSQEARLHHQDDGLAGRSMRDASLHEERHSMRQERVAQLRQSSGLEDGESSSGSSCGIHSTYPPTPDDESIPNSSEQLQDVFTPRISEMLQSDAFSSRAPPKSRDPPGTSAAGTNEGDNQSPAHLSHTGEVDESKIPARDWDNDTATGPVSTQEPLPIMCPPLTAYNYFYRSERDTIVEGMTHADDPLPPVDWNFTPAKKAELLHHHWYVFECGDSARECYSG